MCDRLVTAAELGQLMGKPTSTIYDLSRRQRWPHYKVGIALRFRAEEILQLCRVEPVADDLDADDVATRVAAGLRGQAVRRRSH